MLEIAEPMSIETFDYIIGILAQKARGSFMAAIGANSPEEIPENFRANLLAEIVSGFNSVLPNDYPYMVIAIFPQSEPENIKIGCIQKDKIPGAHDIISKKIFIVMAFKNELPNGKYAIKNLRVDDVSFLGGEELPEP